jgi:gamma-glutamylcyclotransferase (GGCT)/AIG2-like uncharacterized protein YtfP
VMASPLLFMFFYGTLMQGQSNHERFCRTALRVVPATTLGRLYQLPFGFPGLRVHHQNVRAVGTTDYLADAEKQRETPPVPPTNDLVHGELFTFEDPVRRLIAFDALEGYIPDENGLYRRVLVPARTREGTVLAWTYELSRLTGIHLREGRWPAP